MAIILKKKKHDDEDAPTKKKLKTAKTVVAGENEDDETPLARSRPFTGKDQRRALKKASLSGLREKELVSKAKARLEDDDEEEELSEDDIAELVAHAKKTLKRYGGVALTPTNKHKSGLRKDGVRLAKYFVPKSEDADDLVRIVMMRRVDPAPKVGNVSVIHDFGHAVLEKGETYNLPRGVCVHLTECKAGTMIDD